MASSWCGSGRRVQETRCLVGAVTTYFVMSVVTDQKVVCPCVFKHAVYSGILVVNHWAPFSHGELKFFRTLLEPVKKAIAEEYRKGFVYKVLVLGMPMKHVVDVFLNNTVFF